MIDEAYVLKQVLPAFTLEGTAIEAVPHGGGHINDTLKVTALQSDGSRRHYILQKMNGYVFRDMDALMANVVGVTTFLREHIAAEGGDPDREALSVIPARDGRYYYTDSEGNSWRAYLFIEDTFSLDLVSNEMDLYNSAVAFGHFQKQLADYPAASLHETIPHFHDTVQRYHDFRQAVEEDVKGRVRETMEEIRFLDERASHMHVIVDALASGELPTRVTHNDTKLNNVLIDRRTGRGLCVVDLDTVMPGSALYDYGDAIRTGANTAEEDERDLSLVSLDLGLYEVYTRGFLDGCAGILTEKEIRMFPVGAWMMTIETGMRFFADYLQGDVYFKIHRPGQNMDRARCQFAMVRDIEAKWSRLQAITEKYI